jgi:hypothetical protein
VSGVKTLQKALPPTKNSLFGNEIIVVNLERSAQGVDPTLAEEFFFCGMFTHAK